MRKNIYKVFFKGENLEDDQNLFLTFNKLPSENRLKIESNLIESFKTRATNQDNFKYLHNIELVLDLNEESSKIHYENYLLILYTQEKLKTGYLIGLNEEEGYSLVGLWPYTKEIDKREKNEILDLDEILNNPGSYEKIVLSD